MKLLSANNLKGFTIMLLLSSITNPGKAQSIADTPLTKINFGLYGGMNFSKSEKNGESVFFEFKTNFYSNMFLKASAGFSKAFQPATLSIKDYKILTVENRPSYHSIEKVITEKEYDIFSVNAALQYEFNELFLAPYIQAGAGYNTMTIKYSGKTIDKEYILLSSIPEEYKTKSALPLIASSYSVYTGVGGRIKITSALTFDISYIIKFDTMLPDNHNIYFGVYF